MLTNLFRRLCWAAGVSGALAIALSVLPGCHSTPIMEGGQDFPAEKDHGASADIQVIRDVTVISFTNTTARNLPEGVIWANAGYSREFPGLRVGESITLQLGEFRNRFGEPFRAGGFFATERPDALVRLQLETENQMIGFTVISGRPQ